MKKSYCPYCGKQFKYLGLGSHKSACSKRKTIKEQVADLVKIWTEKPCKWCIDWGIYKKSKAYFLDEDGVDVSISGKPGKLCHANLDGFWSCEKGKGKHRRPIGEVEAKAYIRIWGREA